MAEQTTIQWHPAFQQAIRAELYDYRDRLEFIEEYQLTTEPLKMDTLIIKKPPEVKIEKNIGRIFKGHNIVEYKSPEDNLGVKEYMKVFAYLYLYVSEKGISLNDVTLTMVVSNHPRGLLAHLAGDTALTVENQSRGIYYVCGERVPVQIIESKALSEEENLWLHALRRGLTTPTYKYLINESRFLGNEVEAYIYAVSEANINAVKGAREMGFVDSMLSDEFFITHAKTRGFGFIDEAVQETARESAVRMLKDGEAYDKISRWLLLTEEEIAEIDNSLQLEASAV